MYAVKPSGRLCKCMEKGDNLMVVWMRVTFLLDGVVRSVVDSVKVSG